MCDQCDCGCNCDGNCHECGYELVEGPIVGQRLPSMILNAYQNHDIKPVELTSYKGKWLAMVFYPADFTFVCPTELEDLATLYADFQEQGAEVVSVSTDTAFAHLAWHNLSPAVGKVQFPMLADPTGDLARALNVYLEDEGLALRASFIIDPEGVIQTQEVHASGIGRSGAELLRKLKAAKFVYEHGGEVCPANWKPGAKTLHPGSDLVGKL